jgi:hypothetical protein
MLFRDDWEETRVAADVKKSPRGCRSPVDPLSQTLERDSSVRFDGEVVGILDVGVCVIDVRCRRYGVKGAQAAARALHDPGKAAVPAVRARVFRRCLFNGASVRIGSEFPSDDDAVRRSRARVALEFLFSACGVRTGIHGVR